MKQTIVINVSMSKPKCRTKAMQISVCFSGVDSIALKGDGKNQLEITGEGIDVVELTNLLRKKIGHAVVVSVAEKKEEKKVEEKDEVKVLEPPVYYYYGYGTGAPMYQYYYSQ